MATPADAPVMPKELDPEMKKVFMHIQANKPRYIETLREAVSIRSVSALPEARAEVVRMVKWTAQKLTDIGVTVELRKIGEQTTCEGEVIPLPPVIFGHIGQDPSKKTVLIYGHLDVQPAKMEDGWDTEPFSLTEFDGKMFGRGATDDKGPVLGWIHAIEAYHQSRVEIPVNIKFCLEAMEESGSEGLEALLRCSADSFLADIDFVCISDNYWLGRDHPCLTYGLRGLCYFFVEVECGSKDLHSGVFGGSVFEAMPDLVFLMNSLVDSDGKILVPGLTDEVAPLTQEEADTYKALKFDNEEFRLDAGVHKLRHPEDFTKTLMSHWRYPSLSIQALAKKAILTPKNEHVHQLNEQILNRSDGQEVAYFSTDSIHDDGEGSTEDYPLEFINTLTPSGFPLHQLKLKVGAIIMLLRNLCNGTRLIIKSLKPNVICAEILQGRHEGQQVLLPRIDLVSSESDFSVEIRRRQFPVALAFVMSIKKAQGQSLESVGIYLPFPVFSHGQLYVAFSRCTKQENVRVKMISRENQGKLVPGVNKWFTVNCVYKEIFA